MPMNAAVGAGARRADPPASTAVRAGAAAALVVVFAAACAGRPRPLDDPDRWRSGECRVRFTIEQEDSPTAELHELVGWRDDVQDRFPSAVIDPATQRPVTATAGFRLDGHPIAWWSPTLDVMVLDGAAFAPLRQADATMLPPTTTDAPTASGPVVRHSGLEAAAFRQVVGRVTTRARQALGDRAVLELLLRIEAIRTHWHLGSDICLTSEQNADGAYRAELHGVHHWVGTHRVRGSSTHEARFAFALEIDPEGEVSVVGLPAAPSERRE
jgi:hypothetical protein